MNDSAKNNILFYKGKRVLVTGHTGFKGAWLTVMLSYLGAEAQGYAHKPESGSLYEKIQGDNFIKNVTGDLLDYQLLRKTVQEFQPEIVIHLAAFGFMKECYDDPIQAYKTNVLGTVNLLETLRFCSSVKSIVIVSTDKVYENKGDGALYAEEDKLGGISPYSSSKTCMELAVNDYRETYFGANNKSVGIATVRASNVLAGGDHIQTRLIPTILRSVDTGNPVELRNPTQTRPWQSVLDALNGYLTVARYLYNNPVEYSKAWNIGPTSDGIRSVSWVFERIKASFEELEEKRGKQIVVSESETLGLDISKAMSQLDWRPKLSCAGVIEQVVEFYKAQRDGKDEYQICLNQIKNFFEGDK